MQRCVLLRFVAICCVSAPWAARASAGGGQQKPARGGADGSILHTVQEQAHARRDAHVFYICSHRARRKGQRKKVRGWGTPGQPGFGVVRHFPWYKLVGVSGNGGGHHPHPNPPPSMGEGDICLASLPP